MAVFTPPIQPFKWKPDGGATGVPFIQHYACGQGTGGAAFPYWRNGNVLKSVTTGTVVAPNPNGSLAAFNGPVAVSNASQLSVVTVGTSAVAGAPARTYWMAVSYTDGAGVESQPSPLLPFGCPAGFVPTVTVSAAGAPGVAIDFNLYAGLFPRTWFRQVLNTALGATATLAYPLTNYVGVVPTVAGDSANIVGFASSAFDQVFDPLSGFPGRRNPYGATMSTAPNMGQNAIFPVEKCQVGTFELNMIQPYTGQIGAAVGLNIDAVSGLPVWDTAQTQVATISGFSDGQYQGGLGLAYSRVFARFLASVLA